MITGEMATVYVVCDYSVEGDSNVRVFATLEGARAWMVQCVDDANDDELEDDREVLHAECHAASSGDVVSYNSQWQVKLIVAYLEP